MIISCVMPSITKINLSGRGVTFLYIRNTLPRLRDCRRKNWASSTT